MSAWRLIREQIRFFNKETRLKNQGRFLVAWLDECLSFLLFGSTPDDYYQYEFYSRSLSERNKFITWRRSQKLINENGKNAEKTVEKDRFNRRFEAYLNRDWIDLQTATEAEFRQFLEKHGRVFMKPLGGSCGRGIFILDQEDYVQNGSSVEQYRSFIAEELINQHDVIKKLNPNAVNTVRIITYRGVVLIAVLKLGTGSNIVDNQHANGLNGNIDLETGITNSPFLDLEYKPYYRHPDTGEVLLGVQIPHWQELKVKVESAAQELCEVPYIGWDVAVTPSGIAIIEANEAPGHDLAQGAGKIGIYKKILEIKRSYR